MTELSPYYKNKFVPMSGFFSNIFKGSKQKREVSTTGQHTFFATWGGILSADASPSTMLSVPSVWACIDRISGSIASMPVNLKKETGSGKKRKVVNAYEHPMHDLVKNSPNNLQTPSVVFRSWVLNAMKSGNGYVRVQRNAKNKPFLFPIVESSRVSAEKDKDGNVYYKVASFGTEAGYDAYPDEILHLRWMCDGSLFALNSFNYLKQTLIQALAAQGFLIANIKDGNHSRLILVNKDQIKTKEQREKLQEDLKKNFAGFDKAGNAMGLQGDWSVTQVKDTLMDAQYQQLDTLLDEKVARFFGVQQHVIGLLSRSTNNNIESQNISYVQQTLLPWIVAMEQELNKKLLTETERRNHYFKFSLDGLLRGDTLARYQSYNIAITNGILSPDEVRELEDRNPREDGEGNKYFTPLNMATSGSQETQNDNGEK